MAKSNSTFKENLLLWAPLQNKLQVLRLSAKDALNLSHLKLKFFFFLSLVGFAAAAMCSDEAPDHLSPQPRRVFPANAPSAVAPLSEMRLAANAASVSASYSASASFASALPASRFLCRSCQNPTSVRRRELLALRLAKLLENVPRRSGEVLQRELRLCPFAESSRIYRNNTDCGAERGAFALPGDFLVVPGRTF